LDFSLDWDEFISNGLAPKSKAIPINTFEKSISFDQSPISPFGGKMLKKMAGYSLKFVNRYLDRIGAIPLILHSCSKCDSALTSESLIDLMSSRSTGSS